MQTVAVCKWSVV